MKQITHEEVIQRLIDIGQRSDDNINDTRFITSYVMQQENNDKKKDKLIVLLKQLINVNYNLATVKGGYGYYEEKRCFIIKQIKALDEELK